MRLMSTRTELAVLRAGTHRNPSISGTVLSGIDDSYFYSEACVETFNRIQKSLKKTGEVPSWRDLCEDPKLSEEVRDRLKKYGRSDAEQQKSSKAAMRAIRQLNEYRQMRGLYDLSDRVVKHLRKGKVNIEEILDQTGEDLVQLRQKRSDDAIVVRFGTGNNADKIVKRLLKKNEANYVPTGFDEFDSKNGGISPGNLFTIGGSSGGGKSALASQLGINWSDMGEDVCMVPLEMTEEEMTARAMANAAELDVRKILFRKLSEGEERKYKKAYRKFVTRRKEKGGSLTFFKPKSDMTIEEILACTYTMNPSIVVIDYISLLKGIDGDDQWQKLGAVARYCKVYAETHNIIIVLLCQVSEEGKIRYAQSIREHSNYCWTFVSNKETREAGIMAISQTKARNGELFDFNLKTNMACMQIRSMTSEERDTYSSASTTTSKKKCKKGSRGKGTNGSGSSEADPEYLKDITDDD